jgi:hypothetical protein
MTSLVNIATGGFVGGSIGCLLAVVWYGLMTLYHFNRSQPDGRKAPWSGTDLPPICATYSTKTRQAAFALSVMLAGAVALLTFRSLTYTPFPAKRGYYPPATHTELVPRVIPPA